MRAPKVHACADYVTFAIAKAIMGGSYTSLCGCATTGVNRYREGAFERIGGTVVDLRTFDSLPRSAQCNRCRRHITGPRCADAAATLAVEVMLHGIARVWEGEA